MRLLGYSPNVPNLVSGSIRGQSFYRERLPRMRDFPGRKYGRGLVTRDADARLGSPWILPLPSNSKFLRNYSCHIPTFGVHVEWPDLGRSPAVARMKMACMHCAASRTHASPVEAPSHQTLLLYMRAVLLALPPHGGMHVPKFGYETKKKQMA